MMREPDAPTSPEADHLVVQVGSAADEPEYMLMISRPSAGRVRVREWSPANWSEEAREHELPVDEVYSRIERADRQRRRISVEMLRVRAWLEGRTR